MSKLLRTTQPAADVTIPNGDGIEGDKMEVTPQQALTLPAFRSARLHQIIRPDGTIWKPDAEGCYVPQDASEFSMCRYYVEVGCMELVDSDTDTTAAD